MNAEVLQGNPDQQIHDAYHTIRDYDVLNLIGTGGFGAVYRAFQRSITRDVAIKVILPQFANNPEFIRRFETEAHTIGHLEHAHIVPLYDYWREADAAYLVMRWLPGNLRAVLNDGLLPLPLVVRIIDQIGSALITAHRRNIIHRDIKPDNILLDEDKNAYLADFGIAQSGGLQSSGLTEIPTDTQTADIVGDIVAGSDSSAVHNTRDHADQSASTNGVSVHGTLEGSALDSSASNHSDSEPAAADNADGDDANNIVGSPSYISPEQIMQKVATPLSDIYSFGIVIYEMLTGRRPFHAPTSHETLRMQLHTVLPALAEVRPELPPALDAVIQRATAKNPADRYVSIAELLSAFHRALPAVQYVPGADSTIQDSKTTQSFPASVAGNGHSTIIVSDPAASQAFDGQADGQADRESGVQADVLSKNPYKGLRRFDADDADDFFGRNPMIEKLLLQISEKSPFVAVVGPSGSGKSSLLHAGVIPALCRVATEKNWFVTAMLPGDDPFAALTEALRQVAVNRAAAFDDLYAPDEQGLARLIRQILPDDGTRLVLVIDQFEQLFSLVNDEGLRTRFVNTLFNAVTQLYGRFRLLVSMRADYYDRPLTYLNFGEMMHRWTEVLLPLTSVDLEQAIMKPAERVGVYVQPELVQEIMRDAYQQTGLLPLLQYTLHQLFERRSGPFLTVDAYRQMGGLTGSLAKRAEEVYAALNADQQRLSQQVFLRLVAPDGATRLMSRRVRRTELAIAGENAGNLNEIVRSFDQARLVTLHIDPTTRELMVEIAHETLISSWGRLRGWLEDNRDELRAQQRLTVAAGEWANNGHDPSFLATGIRLAQFREMAAEGNVALNAEETDYLAACLHTGDTAGSGTAGSGTSHVQAIRDDDNSHDHTPGVTPVHAGVRADNRFWRATSVMLSIALFIVLFWQKLAVLGSSGSAAIRRTTKRWLG